MQNSFRCSDVKCSILNNSLDEAATGGVWKLVLKIFAMFKGKHLIIAF